jgi:GTP-binding protein
MSFVDKVRIYVRAGDGGNGCLSFLREKFMEFGGPNGADGGKGGDVYLQADPHMTTLLDVARRPHIEGKAGAAGKGGDKTGAMGEDVFIHVPVGTVVYRDGALLADLHKADLRFRIAEGGRGGRGNLSFKSRINTAPRIYEKGAPGQQFTLDLELKLIADVGFVGFPNAGKSSLLSMISAARPKVADYPFTTLSPHLGVASHKNVHFVAADIPGLIEGAHSGKGLGIGFLKHVERTRLLVHLVDPLGYQETDPVKGVKVIEDELKQFSSRLAGKPRILVVNKMDLPEGEGVFKKLNKKYPSRKIVAISAATGNGLEPLLNRIITELQKLPVTGNLAESVPESRLVKVDSGFRVENKGGGIFKLRGLFVERAAAMLDPTLPEAIDRFQRTLKKIGVDKALRLAGIEDGDMVHCGSYEFEWSDEVYKPLHGLRRAHKRTRIGVGKKK